MDDIVILEGVRTPFGKYKGSLSALTAVDLGVAVVQNLISRSIVRADEISQVIFGSVLTAGLGQNIARQISVTAGLSTRVPAFTVNEVCGSSLKAILLARQALLLGEATVVLAGGTESMTNASTMRRDGLTDAFEDILMGETVERLVHEFSVSRAAQDAFALCSHQRAKTSDFSSELAAVGALSALETIRPHTSLEKLAALKPVFTKDGTITAGNSSSVNDGAAAVLLTSKSYAKEQQLPFLAIIKAATEIAVAPARMGISPITAIRQLTEKSGIPLSAIDRFEINEAFAASSLIINQELGLDPEKVNVKGGAIALGHPLGASGARLVATLAHQLHDEKLQYGIASLCIGGGLGLAVLLENVAV